MRRREMFLFVFILIAVVISSALIFKKMWPGLMTNVVRWTSRNEASRIAKLDVPTSASPTVEVTDEGLQQLRVGTAGQRDFRQEVRDVGAIDFNQDMAVPVFPSYQGKIIKPLVDVGDAVEKGQVLYTIFSPDLLQAEATFIQQAGALTLTSKNLVRLRQSVKNGGGAQKDLDQAASDQQTAVGAYNAARVALEVFGKTQDDIDRIADSRTVDPTLAVTSPISGAITLRNAAPGMLVQPGTAPAPYSVVDLSQIRMYDYVSEDEAPTIRLGEDVTGHVMAYPDRVFRGKVTKIASTVDPATHRLQVESQIPDPGHLLRPNMFADLVIRTGVPVRSIAVPMDAVVRLGDGTMTVWVKTGERRFVQRIVKIGMQQDGFDQVLDGLSLGEMLVIKGAVFVSNVANANASP